jgi:hypothetical protein
LTTTAETCTPLPPEYQQHPGDGYALATELIGAIKDAIRNSDRTLQRMIGPSEIGNPCNRWIGYKQLHIPERPRAVPWKATVGTGGHMWMETAVDRYNLQHYELLGYNERFYIETKVNVGEVNGVPITGSSDVFDRVTGTVVDWKFPGPNILKGYRRKLYPGDQYRDQAHLYGRGWVRAGFRVNRVMIFFLPRDGELDDHYVWSEAYDEQVALDALERLAGIDLAVQALGTGALELLSTHPHYCNNCPFYMRDSKDLSVGCPGDTGHAAGRPQPSSAELISGRKN